MSSHSLENLAKAQDTRMYRARVLREVAAGERQAADLLLDTADPRVARMPVAKIISAIRRCGDETAKAMLQGYHLSQSITMDRLSPVTRRRLAEDIRELQARREGKQVAA